MERLNTVLPNGTFGMAVSSINTNFSLIVNAINSLEYASVKSKGIHEYGFIPSTETLPNAVNGDWCMVLREGNVFPADIWTFDGTTWEKGGSWNPDEIDLTPYAKTADMTNAIANSLAQALAQTGYAEVAVSGTSLSVSLQNFVLPTSGGTIHLKMSAPGTGATTLNINNTGAKELWYNGAAVSASNTWEANEIISVFYDGTRFMASNSQGGGKADSQLDENSTLPVQNKVVTQAINTISANLQDVDESINNYNYYIEAAGDNWGESTGAIWEYNGDIYTVVGTNHIWVYKNGVIFYTFTSNINTFKFNYGVVGYGKHVYWSTFAVASGNVTWTLHSLDIETKARVAYTDTIVKSFSGSANTYNPVISYRAFNDKLYASIGCIMNYQSTVDLYEITDTGFLYVNRIFTANEEWGKRISTNQSIETNNLSYVKLADDGNTLYCEVGVSRGNLPFVKKLVDNVWMPYSIFMADAAIALNTDFTITPKGRIFHVQANGSLIWLDVTCNHVFQINITDILSVSKTTIGTVSGCLMFWLTDFLYVLFKTSGGNRFKVVKVKKDYLDNIIDGNYTKEIVTTDASALTSLKNGEALMLIGGNNTITQWSSTGGYWPARAVAPTMYFPKDSIWRIISSGVANRYIYYPISYGSEKFSTIPFRSIAYYNPFYSGGFRIPCIDYYKNKFYAMCSARYFTGGDYEPAEGVLCKSTNDGHEWKDYVKALPIISGEGSAEKRSSMDGVMLIDRYASSPHVNRIWAFGRDDNSNFVDADETVEYVHFVARYSDDDGLTWSEPIDLTDALLADAPSDVKLFVSGCSAGITLANGTLVLPIYYTTTASGYNPYATFIYSTDHGDTWKLGDIAPVYSDESVIIQKEDGTLVMSSRARYDNNKHLFFSLSSIGSGWQQIQNTDFPSYTCCYGFGYCNGVYVISAPVNSNRQNITVYASKDLSNWKKIVQVSSGSGNNIYGYSQLVFNQNTLAVLFENKSKNVEFTNLKEYLPSVFGC